MKKILFSICILSAMLAWVGCEPTPIEPSVSLKPDTLTLMVGQFDTVVATITPASAVSTVMLWESSDSKVAKVDTNGVVTAKAEGEAVISLTTDFGSAQCVVNVVKGQLIISAENLDCNVYEAYQLSVTKPEHKAKAKVTWKSSNSAVASVDSKGNVTAMSAGEAVISASVSGCAKAECSVVVKDVPHTLPRKYLIEHFTGDQCGYCPDGMYSILDYLDKATTPTIWVSHHAGFNTDEYTIDESWELVSALGVNGAPGMTMNRSQQEKGLVFHPGYLPQITIADNTKTAMSVEVNHTFNAATRQLDITVSGKSTYATNAQYLLTVLVKENRLVGRQADYYYSYGQSAWREYMHARVIRGMLTPALGDTITLNNQAYSKTYSYTISDKWVPENCCVVAYVTPLSNMPIINAEQVVLVEGTTGGEQYYPYGITESKGPKANITFHAVQATPMEDNQLEVMLVSNSSVSTAYGDALPMGIVYVNTDATTLAPGSYPIQEGNSLGTITAGYRIDEKSTLGGSILVYAVSSYLANGQVAPAHIWRMMGGEMVVDEQGNITLKFNTCSGTSVTSAYQSSPANTMVQKTIKSGMMQLPNQLLNTTNSICQ